MHRLLARQLKKNIGLDDLEELASLLEQIPQPGVSDDLHRVLSGLPTLLGKISASYDQFTRDLSLRARSLELSSAELHEANGKLRQQAQSQAEIIASLRDTANKMLVSEGKEELRPDLKELGCLSQIMADVVRERAQSRVELKNQKFALDQHAIVSVTDLEGNIIYANQKFCEITGYKESELLGQNHRIIRSEQTPDELFEELWLTITRGKVWHGEICNKKKSGELCWVAASIVPLYNQDNKPSGYIAIRTDVTARKQMEEHLRNAMQQAEAGSRAKSEFLATMSHEIRTPMNGVIGMAELLSGTDLTSEQQRYVQNIYNSGDALLNIINDILDFSKLDAKKLELEYREFNVLDLTEGVADLLAPRAFEKGLALNQYVTEELCLQPHFLGDVGRIRQIMLNLLGNAIKFTEKGSIYIEVSSTKSAALRFSIRDTGIGVPKESLNKLFDSFSQVDASTSRRFGGTGLGLAISKRLVELMEGQIGFSSVLHEGSTFWFELPLQKCQRQDDYKFQEGILDIASLSVLVVDDNHLNCEIFERTLSAWGMQTRIVHTVEAAMAEVEQWQPELVLIDLMMPVSCGYRFVTQVRADRRFDSTKLIMVSSMRENEARETMDLQKLDAYLVKPVKRAGLLAHIYRVFGEKNPGLEKDLDTADGISNQPGTKNGLKILLAEDNSVNQEVAVGLLNRLGHEVVVAENGLIAIDVVKKTDIDLVFMDIQMPLCDGYKAIEEIRKLPGHKALAPIIALTANAMKGDREKCLQAGADDYLSKPINKDKLYFSISNIVGANTSLKPHGPVDSELQGVTDFALQAENSVWQEEAVGSMLHDLGESGYAMVLATFLKNTRECISQIEAGLLTADTQSIHKAGHSLKGASISVGAKKLSALAKKLEQHGCEAVSVSELKEAFAEFEMAVSQRFPANEKEPSVC